MVRTVSSFKMLHVSLLEFLLTYLVTNGRNSFNGIRHSIVASIPACHAGDQGSIPCDGTNLLLLV